MIELKDDYIKGLSKDESYIIRRSLIDAWGYPYRPDKIKILYSSLEYKNVDDKLEKNNREIDLNDLGIIINALELLYFENIDLEALYDNIDREDVKLLIDRLEKFHN
jgi:hypothetical protein